MDSKKIGTYIKELRIKNNLSQGQLAEKLSVTNQAISKWENGRGLPDIEMLKQLSSIFNVKIDEIIQGEHISKEKKNTPLIILTLIIILIISVFGIIILVKNNTNNFVFNTIASDNNNFSIKGVIAYNQNKKSIYISDIKYSAVGNEEKYVVAECILYEVNGNNEKKISQCGDINNSEHYSKDEATTLTGLLKDVEFNIDSYTCSCGKTDCNSLYLRINAINVNDKTVTYNIPIQIDNKCNK